MAKSLGAEVTFLYAVEEPVLPYADMAIYMSDFYEDLKKAGETALAVVASKAATLEVPARTVLAERQRPVTAILEAAEDHDAIVIATHGRRGFDRYVFGSVTEAVLRRTKTPCLIIHCQPVAEAAEQAGQRTDEAAEGTRSGATV